MNEAFDIPGPAGRLEAILMRPDEPAVAAAVVCHAHPLHGGMMHFKVVFRAAKALSDQGLAVLRFNFRGVGRSEGVHDHGRGEQDDVRGGPRRDAAAASPACRWYSGASRSAPRWPSASGPGDARVDALFALGFPLSMLRDTTFLAGIRQPACSSRGSTTSSARRGQVRESAAQVPEPRRSWWSPARTTSSPVTFDELQERRGLVGRTASVGGSEC